MIAPHAAFKRKTQSDYSDLRQDNEMIRSKIKERGGFKVVAHEIGISNKTLSRFVNNSGVMQRSKVYRLYDLLCIPY